MENQDKNQDKKQEIKKGKAKTILIKVFENDGKSEIEFEAKGFINPLEMQGLLSYMIHQINNQK